MRIKMKTTVAGSRDGAVSEQFRAGTVHDLGGTPRELDLAEVFVREGWAEAVQHGAPASSPQADPVPPPQPRPAPEGKRRGR